MGFFVYPIQSAHSTCPVKHLSIAGFGSLGTVVCTALALMHGIGFTPGAAGPVEGSSIG